jgi:hypothetical protein
MAAKPKRVQLKRTKGWRMPANTVKVDRTSRWGNPFVIGERSPGKDKLGAGTPRELCGVLVRDRAHAIELFRKWVKSPSDRALAWRTSAPMLRGQNLACWCPPGEPCHADVLIELANLPPVRDLAQF